MQDSALRVQGPTESGQPDGLALLEQFGTSLSLRRDQELYPEGSDATHIYRVVSGCVRTVKLMADGRRQVCTFMFAGDLIGLDDTTVHDFGAEAVTESVLRRYPRRTVDALAESAPVLGRALRDDMMTSLHAIHQQLTLLGRRTASERIAAFLLEMDRRIPRTTKSLLHLPMSRGDIADYLGLTVETVCRLLAQMKRDQILIILRAGVQLLDRAALRHQAG
jgi:CRP/FNR family nitrogen fixation transcriptional regulator